MRGEIVFVRDAHNKPLVRRVWEDAPDAIYICNEDRYQRLLKDYDSDLPPIGFPVEDVFYYDPNFEEILMANYQHNPQIWEQLEPYKGGALII